MLYFHATNEPSPSEPHCTDRPGGCLPQPCPGRSRDARRLRRRARSLRRGRRHRAFGAVERDALGSFRAVFEAVAHGEAAAGVVPIENVIHGTVRENYDLLIEHDLEIRGEVVVPVRLCLAALPGQRLDDIERVYSHIQALGQAEAFLRARPWQLLSTYNTAGAGKAIADRGERGAAAVLSPRAAALFGLEVLADEIGDLPDNRTRFARAGTAGRGRAAAHRPTGAPAGRRLVVAVRNEPGTLLAVLRVLAAHGLNMRKLESRPSRERAWEYVFWIDLDGDVAEPAMAAALDESAGVTTMTPGARQLPEPGRLTGLGRPGPMLASAPQSGHRSGGVETAWTRRFATRSPPATRSGSRR